MFSYLRHFFLISILVVILAAVFMSWYAGRISNKVILGQSEQSSVALVDAYKRTLWEQYNTDKGFNHLLYGTKAQERLNSMFFSGMATETKRLFSNSSIITFNIYVNNLKGYSSRKVEDNLNDTDLAKVKDLANNRLSLFMSLSKYDKVVRADNRILPPLGTVVIPFDTSSHKVFSEIVDDAYFTGEDGRPHTSTLVRTLIPIYFDENVSNDEADAIFEIYYDASSQYNTLIIFQYLAIGLILGIFTIMLVTLIYISGRAEKTILRQHETTSELMAAKIKAETSNAQKTQFLASISHELRTPLNAIIGFSEIIKDEVMGPLENEQYKNYIKDIHGSGVHLLSLINDILDFSKAEAGKLEVEYDDVDLNKLITTALRLQEPRALTGDVKLEKDLPADHIIIYTDNKRLKQVLLNLLSNAVKFTPIGGKVKASAWNDVKNGNICIEVADTGIGIAPKDLAKAMTPFGQISSDLSRRYEGTGLGLPLAKKFTELLGGILDIESEVGKGTKIRISLPKNGKEGKVSTKSKLVF